MYGIATARSGAAAILVVRAITALIRFVDGPAGRRPRLHGTGLDVWEAISVVRDNDGDEREAAEYLQVPLGLIQAAVTYYGAYRDEIDEWRVFREHRMHGFDKSIGPLFALCRKPLFERSLRTHGIVEALSQRYPLDAFPSLGEPSLKQCDLFP